MAWTPQQRLEDRRAKLREAGTALIAAQKRVADLEDLVAELFPTKTSQAGVAFIGREEGIRLEAYQDVVGVWTIGYGHTGKDVKPGLKITQEKARALLAEDLGTAEGAVVAALRSIPRYQSQFDALVSLAFNIGAAGFGSSTLVRKLRAGDYLGAADEFPKWNKAGNPPKPIAGLTARRARERAMFLKEMT